MRINMNGLESTQKAPRSLIMHWCSMLASEYHVSEQHALKWIGFPENAKFVAEFLKRQGWRVESYTTPSVETNRSSPSWGYVVADDCERLLTWRLTA